MIACSLLITPALGHEEMVQSVPSYQLMCHGERKELVMKGRLLIARDQEYINVGHYPLLSNKVPNLASRIIGI
jgi:hypothetical protein